MYSQNQTETATTELKPGEINQYTRTGMKENVCERGTVCILSPDLQQGERGDVHLFSCVHSRGICGRTLQKTHTVTLQSRGIKPL